MRELLAAVRGQCYRLSCRILNRNISIHKGLKIFKKLEIKGEGKVMVDENCAVAGIIGNEIQHVTLFTHSSDAVIRIGKNARLFAARVSSKFEVIIGDDVLIEEASITDTDFHSIGVDRGNPQTETREKCRVVIGNGVSIGARSIITKGVTIGDGSLIGPGAVVTRSVPPGSLALGNPAKVIIQDLGSRRRCF